MISFAMAPAMKPIMMYQMMCNIGVRGSGYGKWNVDMLSEDLPVRAIDVDGRNLNDPLNLYYMIMFEHLALRDSISQA